MTDTERALGRIEGQLKGLDTSVNRYHDRFEKQDKRISALERWRAGVHYVGAFVAALAAATVAYFKS